MFDSFVASFFLYTCLKMILEKKKWKLRKRIPLYIIREEDNYTCSAIFYKQTLQKRLEVNSWTYTINAFLCVFFVWRKLLEYNIIIILLEEVSCGAVAYILPGSYLGCFSLQQESISSMLHSQFEIWNLANFPLTPILRNAAQQKLRLIMEYVMCFSKLVINNY